MSSKRDLEACKGRITLCPEAACRFSFWEVKQGHWSHSTLQGQPLAEQQCFSALSWEYFTALPFAFTCNKAVQVPLPPALQPQPKEIRLGKELRGENSLQQGSVSCENVPWLLFTVIWTFIRKKAYKRLWYSQYRNQTINKQHLAFLSF